MSLSRDLSLLVVRVRVSPALPRRSCCFCTLALSSPTFRSRARPLRARSSEDCREFLAWRSKELPGSPGYAYKYQQQGINDWPANNEIYITFHSRNSKLYVENKLININFVNYWITKIIVNLYGRKVSQSSRGHPMLSGKQITSWKALLAAADAFLAACSALVRASTMRW